ncbi:hypothetical protein C8R44DRAFT_859356 [Mycena epipterygia]|nr:hypothetical protein C8R44DRAFT_859356 [Mycena epipterygia]
MNTCGVGDKCTSIPSPHSLWAVKHHIAFVAAATPGWIRTISDSGRRAMRDRYSNVEGYTPFISGRTSCIAGFIDTWPSLMLPRTDRLRSMGALLVAICMPGGSRILLADPAKEKQAGAYRSHRGRQSPDCYILVKGLNVLGTDSAEKQCLTEMRVAIWKGLSLCCMIRRKFSEAAADRDSKPPRCHWSLSRAMVNATGTNGTAEQDYPEGSVLYDAFIRYSRENSGSGLGTEDQLARLQHDFNLQIRKTKLYSIRKRLGIETVKKSGRKRTEVETRLAVMDLKQSNVAGGWGVTQVKGRLANAGVLIPRDSLREILHNEFDEEFENHFVGKKKKVKHRTPLKAFGPWHQEHSDGHEKLSEQGLNIGIGIHLPIYGSKDQWSSFVHALLLMPNVRNRTAIAHYYLDLVEARDFTISAQLITDLRSEVDEMHKIHEQLRDEVAPELVPPEHPHGLKQSSTTNTPIESFWRWLRDGDGHSTKQVLQEGAATGIFLLNDEIHRRSTGFAKVEGKKNAYGSSPQNMLINPKSIIATARDCSIKVNPEIVQRLRETYGGEEARDTAFRFISREFQAEADGIYVDLGCPEIILPTAWNVFQQVVKELQRRVLAV